MKIIKKSHDSINKEAAHGGAGFRKVYADGENVSSKHFDMMTHGYLPGGETFDWHDHLDTEEIMVVISGTGEVHDEDGVYEYAPGDVFVFPANTKHKVHNPTKQEHEMIYVRVKS